MDLKLVRKEKKDTGIFSEIQDMLGKKFFSTCEHSYDGQPKIPNGVFKCVRGDHVLHSGPINTFEVTGVEGHHGLLFHSGNTEKDSEGCILVGMSRENDSVISSRTALHEFLVLQNGEDEFQLTVE